MIKEEAYKIVFDDLTREDGCSIFRGIYDAKNCKDSYMYGVSHVIQYIAIQVSEETRDNFEDMFLKNMLMSEEKAENPFKEDCPELYSKDTVDKALCEIEKKEEEKEPEVVIGEIRR